MQKLKMILILPLIIFLSSCKDDFPAIAPKERCAVVIMDTLEESYCRCHMYAWTLSGIGRITESQNYELQKCNKLIGFNVEDTVAIYEWQEAIRLWLLRRSK